MAAETPSILHRGWVRTHLAIILIAIAVTAAVAGGATYYVVYLAGCRPSSNLKFYENLTPSEKSFVENTLIPEFQTDHPNITVTLVNLPTADREADDVKALVQANCAGTTLVGIDNLVVGELIYSSSVTNLTSIIGNIEPPNLIPSAQNVISYQRNIYNATYFIPFRSNVPLVFYDKRAFSAAGVSTPPSTTDELMADAAKLASSNYKTPLMVQGGGMDNTPTELYQWMVQFGGNPFMFNDTGDVKAFQYLYNASSYFSPDYATGYWGSYHELYTGDYQILDYQWPYVYNLLTNATGGFTDTTLGVYPGPVGPANGNHLLGGDVLVVPRGATNLNSIETFARFLLDTKAQGEMLQKLSWVAVNNDAYSNLPANQTVIGQQLLAAVQQGIFLRNPAPWISQWNAYANDAWSKIIGSHAPSSRAASYDQIQTILTTENNQLYQWLVQYYGSKTAQQYEQNVFKPISV